MTIQIALQDELNLNHTPTLLQFEQWVNAAIDAAQKTSEVNDIELTIRIVSKKESAHLNETFRHKKGPTNILAFQYETNSDIVTELGDLAICADIVVEEAREQEKPIQSHWAHLAIHGTLHLLGFRHDTDEQADTMETLEIAILKRLGYSNPYEPKVGHEQSS